MPNGVPISAIIFGGRRSNTMPLVFQAFNWIHGVYVGADDGLGDDGRRDRRGRAGAPRSDGDAAVLRLQHRRLLPPLVRDRPAPDESAADFPRQLVPQRMPQGKFLWPGFGDNMRVLKWIIDRCEGRGGAQESPIGCMPRPEDLDLKELEVFRKETCANCSAVEPDEWAKELAGQEEFFKSPRAEFRKSCSHERKKLAARLGR